MVQELPDRHALDDRTGVAVQVEHVLVDELEHEGADEDLGHAGDAEAMVRRHRLAGPEVRDACRLFPAATDRGRNHTREPGLHDVGQPRLHGGIL